VTASGLDGVLPMLACPHCSGPLARCADGALGCPAGHRFDVARQGYVSLLGKGSRTDTGDSADMVAARSAFLAAGHYRPVADAVASMVDAAPVLEIGAGTGYYLGVALDRLARNGSENRAPGIALDSSRYAARRSTARPDVGSVVADAWSPLPVRDGAVSTVLSIFAPRDPAGIARVLAPGGRLVVVTPEPDHLGEIRSELGLLLVDPGKPQRLAEAFGGLLQPVVRTQFRREMALTRADVSALARMGPAARHVDSDRLRSAVGQLAEITRVTLSVTVSVLEARPR
jgi:23S rRNA (guanine745-N1)-methyltransferase